MGQFALRMGHHVQSEWVRTKFCTYGYCINVLVLSEANYVFHIVPLPQLRELGEDSSRKTQSLITCPLTAY